MIKHFLPLLFLLTVLSGITIFAHASAEETKEEQCKFSQSKALEYPGSFYWDCKYRLQCEGLQITRDYTKSIIDNDYLIQLFLRKNPDVSLDDALIHGLGFDPATVMIIREMHWPKSYPVFVVTFNFCADITRYEYGVSDNDSDGSNTRYLERINFAESLKIFEEGKLEIASRILGHYPSPEIQISEFNIPPNEIRCNAGLDLYKHNDYNTPMCLKPHTYDRLLERGFEASRYYYYDTHLDRYASPKIQISEFNIPPDEIRCNAGLDLYKHNDYNTPMCLKPHTYDRLLERGFEASRYDNNATVTIT